VFAALDLVSAVYKVRTGASLDVVLDVDAYSVGLFGFFREDLIESNVYLFLEGLGEGFIESFVNYGGSRGYVGCVKRVDRESQFCDYLCACLPNHVYLA